MGYESKSPGAGGVARRARVDQADSAIDGEDNDLQPFEQGFTCSASHAAAARTDAVIRAAFRRLMRPDMQLARAVRLAEIADLPEQRDALDCLERVRRLTPPCPTCGSRGAWWEDAAQ